ncbi:MAG: ATP-binding protein [Nitrososphaeria archaeon]
MNLQEIKRAIVSQREEMEEKFSEDRIVKREPEISKLKGFLAFPNVLVVLGIRRCGKSIFSWQIFKNDAFGYINFDDERLYGVKADTLDLILQSFYELYGNIDYIILDEPQNVTGWELFVNRLRRTKKVIVTGSNSKLLSGELATHLTGRHVSFTLMPFSFREYLNYKKLSVSKEDFYSTQKVAELKRSLEEYMKIGGLPETYLFGKEILVRIYSDIIEKDILKRTKIKMKETFRNFIRYLISNVASEFTIRKLSNVFEIRDVHTVRNWLSALENAYLFFVLERYSPKLKQQIIAPKKIYCTDNGLVNTMSFKTDENYSRLMENLVAIELLRRKNYWQSELETFYWKDHQQNEVDFVLKEGTATKQLIQVTYASSKNEIKNREIRSLTKASNELKCKNLLIITSDYEDTSSLDNKTIKYIPLWKWLLQEKHDISNKHLLAYR